MMICAPLTKSPNCASQSTSASRRRDRVAVLEAERRVLGQRRVVHLERRLPPRRGAGSARRSRRSRRRAGRGGGARTCRARCPGRSAGSGSPRRAGCESASASAWPQSIPPASSACHAPLELRRELRVDREALGYGAQLRVQRAQPLRGHGCDHVASVRGVGVPVADRRPTGRPKVAFEPLVRVAQSRLLLLGRADRPPPRRTTPSSTSRAANCSRTDGWPAIRAAISGCVYAGLVLLVVAVAPVADEVDDDVVAEAAAEGHREPDRRDRGLGVVGVDVDDRHVEALGEVARVAGRAPVARDRS